MSEHEHDSSAPPVADAKEASEERGVLDGSRCFKGFEGCDCIDKYEEIDRVPTPTDAPGDEERDRLAKMADLAAEMVDDIHAFDRDDSELARKADDWRTIASILRAPVAHTDALAVKLLARINAAADELVGGGGNLVDPIEAYHQLYEAMREAGFSDLPGGTFESYRSSLPIPPSEAP